MKVLALDLSTAEGSIVFSDLPNECFAAQFANDRKHSGLFFENLQHCYDKCGNPEQIVVGLGPGSYAGTRIAIAAAVGLQAATGAELIGIPSLCALPTDAFEYVVLGDARRESFWFAVVQARRCIVGPELCTRAELAARISSPAFAMESLFAFPTVPVLYPSARVLAEIAPSFPDPIHAPLEPLYLREPHITQPKSARA